MSAREREVRTVRPAQVPGRLLQPSEDADVTEIGLGWVWREPDGVVRLLTRVDHEMDEQDARELVQAYRRLAGGRPVVVLADLGTTQPGSTAARQFLAGPEASALIAAVACLVPTPVERMNATVFNRVQQPPYEARLFQPGAADDALTWLKSERDRPAVRNRRSTPSGA